MKRLTVAVASALLLLAAASCSDSTTSESSRDERYSGFSPCPTPVGQATEGNKLARVSLPCMDGSGKNLRLGSPLGKPVVINVWGSWCPPCGKELPSFVSVAKAAKGRILIMGAITEDSASRSVAAAHDLGVEFPNLYDRQGELRRALGISALPATLFIDANGELQKTYVGPVLDDPTLREQIARYLRIDLA